MKIDRQVLVPDRFAYEQRIRQIIFREQKIEAVRVGLIGLAAGR